MTLDQLKAICTRAPAHRLAGLLGGLNAALDFGAIDSPKRQAAFVAQLAHESGEFRYAEEIASGEAYEGRRDLGNTHPGDGRRYKGRGWIQLTGRANYHAAGTALGLNLEEHPEQAAQTDIAFKVAVFFWNSRGLSKFADAGDFDAITRRINGGLNGKDQRDTYYARALQALGAP